MLLVIASVAADASIFLIIGSTALGSALVFIDARNSFT